MEMLEIMRTRRSVRKYTAQEISDEDVKKILSAALLAPSGHSKYPCEFIVVKNRETLNKMSQCRVNVAKMLETAFAAVVVIADKEKSDTIVEDCSVAMMNMELEAASLGIGNCWIQIRGRNDSADGSTCEEYLRGILNFPEKFACQSILALGYPEKMPRQRELDKLKFEKIHYENF